MELLSTAQKYAMDSVLTYIRDHLARQNPPLIREENVTRSYGDTMYEDDVVVGVDGFKTVELVIEIYHTCSQITLTEEPIRHKTSRIKVFPLPDTGGFDTIVIGICQHIRLRGT